MRILIFGVMMVATVAAMAKGSRDFRQLFDGKTLAGWQALPGGEWSVVDGAIVGKQEKSERRHGQLVSDRAYGDFILKLKYRAVAGNSGVYFRVAKVEHAVAVKGFQAEVDATGKNTGGLYETLGRAWVTRPDKALVDKVYRPQEWNEMTIVAVGGDLTVAVNDVVMSELRDDPGAKEGFIALQLHGGQAMDVAYKDIRIRELPSAAQPAIHWAIHDRDRPLPAVVAPKPAGELAVKAKAPDGATVLFDGASLDAWNGPWTIVDGVMQTSTNNKGNMTTKEKFGSCRLHLEWRVTDPKGAGNSGVYLLGQYEVQVFNSHNNRTKIYADGQAGAIYGQYPPLANACRSPGEWEYYDIDFTAPTFDAAGKLATPARITVYHNGVLIQDDVALTGPTGHYTRPFYRSGQVVGPLLLQHHGDVLQYRNVWIVPK